MTKEEKQLLIKDFSARLPYGVKAEARGWDEEKEGEVLVPVTVYSVNTDGYVYFADNDYDITYCSVDACRLCLRPMSSMTEEECKELGELSATIENVGETLPNVPYYIEVARPEQIDWLLAHHFDVRGLIPKGLAIEAPEDMYKTEK